ncbi:MAG TPA: dienelactone hydrolase family protein [Kofleriaceae bacterium]
MKQSELRYSADEVTLTGVLVDGSRGAPAPGVLVAHEAPGRDERMVTWAHKLASAGFVALALDLYGAPFSIADAASRHEEMMQTPGLMLARARAALDALAAQPNVDGRRLAAIGFCQGGIAAAELARAGAPIACAIGFHPGLTRPTGSVDGPIDAKVLMMVGDRDPVTPPAHRVAFAAEMDTKGADWQLHVFGGVGHTYTNPRVDALGRPGFAYDAKAERRAWALAMSLLDEVFEQEPSANATHG